MSTIALRWRPHTEKPEGVGPMTALLAGPDDGDEPFIWGVYMWRDGSWHSEDTLQPLKPSEPFWWAPEEEIVPRVEVAA